jgi:hypothetical protein
MATQVLCLPGEIWKPLLKFSHIEASSLGRVRRIAVVGTIMTVVGVRQRVEPARVYAQDITKTGYVRFAFNLNGTTKHVSVHRAVCEAFHGPAPTDKSCACHIDGDRLNNRPENLRWGSYKDNSDDKRRHGRLCRGETTGTSKLTEDNVRAIRTLGASGHTNVDLGRKFGVNHCTISMIKRRRSWAHVE